MIFFWIFFPLLLSLVYRATTPILKKGVNIKGENKALYNNLKAEFAVISMLINYVSVTCILTETAMSEVSYSQGEGYVVSGEVG